MKLRKLDELLNGSRTYSNGIDDYVDLDDVIRIFSEHTSDIRKVIEEMILQAQIFKWSKYKNVVQGQVKALTELLEILKENMKI